MTRQPKSPHQRAVEALAVEERRVKRLTEKADRLRAELADVEAERDTAEVRRAYYAQHPDLVVQAQDEEQGA
jgi:hypothetical protein